VNLILKSKFQVRQIYVQFQVLPCVGVIEVRLFPGVNLNVLILEIQDVIRLRVSIDNKCYLKEVGYCFL